MNTPTIIRAARKSCNLNQQELGKRARVSQSQLSLIEGGKTAPSSETVERILRATGHRLVAIPTTREDAASIASHISEAIKNDRPDSAHRWFVQLSQNLAAEHGAVRFALTIGEPEFTGARHWDAAIAAVVAHFLDEEGLPIPDWAASDRRTLKRSWVFGDGPFTIAPERSAVPEHFLRRRVLIDRDALASA